MHGCREAVRLVRHSAVYLEESASFARAVSPVRSPFIVPMLIALWMLVIQLLASVPGAHPAPGWTSARSSADVSTSGTSTSAGAARAASISGARDDDASIRDDERRLAIVWMRSVQLAGVLAARSATVPFGLAADSAARLSAEATFAASVRVRTLDASHEVRARGALLPYYPTAPPLQG